MSTTVRAAVEADAAAIRGVHEQAFPTGAEAALVERLLANGRGRVSLVAEHEGVVVGHVLLTPVTVGGAAAGGLGLAPVAVVPSRQRQGLGAALVRAALEECRALGCPFVVVLGEPGYYGRFGFARARARGLTNEYGVDEEFMVHELLAGSLPAPGGLVRYSPEFGELAS